MQIHIFPYLALSVFVFVVGIFGIISSSVGKKSIFGIIISIELLLLASNINFLIFASKFADVSGYVFIAVLMAIGAVEIVIGLAIASRYYNIVGNINASNANKIVEEIE